VWLEIGHCCQIWFADLGGAFIDVVQARGTSENAGDKGVPDSQPRTMSVSSKQR
jgi:hypothetical protein